MFGGIHAVLTGDENQSPVVAPGLSDMPLHQAIVTLNDGLSMLEEATQVEATFFTKFKLIVLDG